MVIKMEKEKTYSLTAKQIFLIVMATVLVAALVAYGIMLEIPHIANLTGNVDINLNMRSGPSGSVHTLITIEKKGEIIFQEYHAGALTQLGMNVTLGKLTGNTTYYNMTQYNLNLTYVSIGNGAPSATSEVLPGEWNRTYGNVHDATYNSFNITAIFKATSGSQTASCIGLNLESGIGVNDLWGYDTFGAVSGIDSTFVITVEIKVTIT